MHEDLNQLPLDQLFDRLVDDAALSDLIHTARREDMGTAGDVTSRLFVPAGARARAEARSRSAGVLAGAALLGRIAGVYDEALEVSDVRADGSPLGPGDVIATVAGPLRSVLSAERVMLNFLSHLSGIATLTARYVDAVAGTKAKIYDTRKTIPGLRGLAKYAVRCGGGYCHRVGLYDAVLVKDNHIAHVPPHDLRRVLDGAVAEARRHDPKLSFIEVEVDTLEQLRAVLGSGVDVLLDNMPPDRLREAVAMRDKIDPAVHLEASGGVTLETVRAVAQTGVDRIAIGALTHSAVSLDIGLDIETDGGSVGGAA